MGEANLGDAARVGIEGASAGAANVFDGGDILIDAARERTKPSTIEGPTQTNLSDTAIKSWEKYRSDQLDAEAKTNKHLTNVSLGRDINELVDNVKQTDLELISHLDEKDLKAIGDVGEALAKNDVRAALEGLKQAYDKENYNYDSMRKLDVGLNTEMKRRGLDGTWIISIAYGPDDGHFQIIKDMHSKNSKSQIIQVGK